MNKIMLIIQIIDICLNNPFLYAINNLKFLSKYFFNFLYNLLYLFNFYKSK